MPFAGAVLQDDLAAAGAGHREEKHASVDGVVAGCDGTGKQERGVDRQVFEVDLGVVHLVVVEEPRGDEVLEYEIETHGAIALADPQLTDEQRVQRRQAELGQAVLELGQRVLYRVAQAREKLGVGSGAALDVGGCKQEGAYRCIEDGPHPGHFCNYTVPRARREITCKGGCSNARHTNQVAN